MAVGNLEFIKSASGSTVSSLSVTDCISADYDVYQITVVESDTSATGWQKINFIDSGGTDTTANYDFACLELRNYTSFGENRYTNLTNFPLIWYQDENLTDFGGYTCYVFNPYDSSSYTFVQHQTVSYENANNSLRGDKGIGVQKTAVQNTGINFFPMTGNYDNIEVKVYGVK